MFEREMEFFVANQDRLVREYPGKVLVIRADNVEGAYESPLRAYLDAQQRFAPGSYMIQPCEPGPGAYTVTIASDPEHAVRSN